MVQPTEDMSDFIKVVAGEIKKMRKTQNVTQEELAERLGIAKVTVTLYEAGRNNFTLKTLEKVAEALGYTMEINFKKK